MRRLSLGLLMAVLANSGFAQPATVPSVSLLELRAHETCPEDGHFASFLRVQGKGLPISLESGEDLPEVAEKAAPFTVRVRRGGSDVSNSEFGFKRTKPVLTAPTAPLPSSFDVEIEAVLCQSRHEAKVTVGNWIIQSADGDFRLRLNGELPSEVVTFPRISYLENGTMTLALSIRKDGQILAEDTDAYILKLDYLLPVERRSQ